MNKVIRIACQAHSFVPLHALKIIQGDLKELTKENYEKLKAAILDDGFSFAIHCWKSPGGDACILDGTQRKRALDRMQKEGYIIPDLPVVWVEADSFKQAAIKLLHGASTYGIVVSEGLKQFMTDYNIEVTDMVTMEYRDIDLLQFLNVTAMQSSGGDGAPDPDTAPDPAADPILKTGQLVLMGDHRLLVGDATDPQAYARLMRDDRADLVWTDPPYNVDYEGGTGMTIMNDKMDDNKFLEFLTKAFTCMAFHSKPGGGFYIAHADSEGFNFRSAVKTAGWDLKQCLVWVKSALVMGRQDYQWRHEPILYGWKPGAAHHWYSDRSQTTVLEFPKPSRNELHPTMKPLELVEYCLQNSSVPGAIILDPFGGSGTTLIAAERLKRSARILELDPRYADVIVARYVGLTGQKAEIIG